LTVGGELDKLAGNVSYGRNFAGIHWRSDASAGLPWARRWPWPSSTSRP
jgi:hypothetical protein